MLIDFYYLTKYPSFSRIVLSLVLPNFPRYVSYTLYNTPSAPCRAVLLCASALGVELKIKELDLMKGEHLKPEYLKINPQHSVPALVDDDGFTFWDSHAIMPYLVARYGEDKSLYPEDIQKRAVIDQRLHFDSNILYNRGRVIGRGIILNNWTEIPAADLQGLKDAFDFVEKFLENKNYVAGDELSIADFSFVSTISTWLYFLSLKTYPRMQAWLKRMESLPYYAKANKKEWNYTIRIYLARALSKHRFMKFKQQTACS